MLAAMIVLDRQVEISLGRQLFTQIRQLIELGRLSSGWKLPPSRQLAKDLSVGRNTVLAAYEQLVLEGYLESDGRRGTRVSDASIAFRSRQEAEAVSTASIPEPRLSKQAEALMTVGRRDFPTPHTFQPGLPEVRQFPHDLWGRLVRRATRQMHYRWEVAGYAHYSGLSELKKAILDHVASQRGVVASTDQVMILSSAQAALDLVARLLLDAGDVAMHEEPGYAGMLAVARGVDARLKPIDVSVEDAYTKLHAMEGAQGGPRLIYASPSHQFPTGRMLTLKERLALLEYATGHDAFILEDDYDSEFQFGGEPISCLQGLDRRDLVVYMGTFSKTLMPSLHVAYLIVPQRLIEPARRVLRNVGAVPSAVVQLALADFLSEGAFRAHVRAMNKLYEERRDCLVSALDSYCRNWLEVDVPSGGIQLPAYLTQEAIKRGHSDQQLVESLALRGVESSAVSQLFWSGEVPIRQGLFLGYAASDIAEIEAGVKQVARCLEEKGS